MITKPLTSFKGQYRVICPYYYLKATDDWYFCTDEDGITEWDYFIPLSKPKNSHLYIYDKDKEILGAYISSSRTARHIYESLDKKYIRENHNFDGEVESVLLLDYNLLFDPEATKILSITTKGRKTAPKSFKNLPTYNPSRKQEYSILDPKNFNLLKKLTEEKWGSKGAIMKYKTIYKKFQEKYKLNLVDEADKESITPIQYIDKHNLYKKVFDIINGL